ncbi:hypothetical protein H7F51_16895 [Novosphingobium flavum]|uniref:DUF5681 domain-containing protein n=1 Tax=Novosphingobium flavum TaxID=1778672 RepID=A0A7X1KNC0_9SPHN|nr:DUF5681 domain-containing protein [Novosphingobium flavum]MBC2667200.1 hypothetical protein [Novosphingobium flavum]
MSKIDDIPGEPSDDDLVGYGRPPKHSRFKPGQSGNPKGRPRGSRGLKTDLHEVLSARHTIQINGKTLKGTRQQLALVTLSARAATGDLKAQALLLPLIMQVFGTEDRGGDKNTLPPAELAMLEGFLAGIGELPVEAAATAADAAMAGHLRDDPSDHDLPLAPGPDEPEGPA